MPNTCCSVPLCTQRGGHLFPREHDLREKWISAIRRDQWTPGKCSIVCQAHFRPEDYLQHTYHSVKPSQRTLKNNAVPSVFTWTKLKAGTGRDKHCKKIEKTSHKSRKCQKRLKKAKLKNTVSRSRKILAPLKPIPSVAHPQSTSVVIPVKANPVPVKNTCPVLTSPSVVATPKTTSQFAAEGLKVDLAVPKEGQAGKLVINNQNCKMPDPNALLRMLKLPPNVMFHINATSTKIFNKVIPRSAASNAASTGIPRMPMPLSTEPPVKFISKAEELSEILPPRSAVAVKPETDLVSKSNSNWIKQNVKECDSSHQEDQLTVINGLLEPTVEMYFECEEQTVNDIKTDQTIKGVKQELAVKDMKADRTVQNVKTLDGDCDAPVNVRKLKRNVRDSVRRSTRLRRSSVRMNDL